jgi:hypothetical protein
MGRWIAARLAARGLACERGQGTVEYLGLLLAIGALLLAVKGQLGASSSVAHAVAERFSAVIKSALPGK